MSGVVAKAAKVSWEGDKVSEGIEGWKGYKGEDGVQYGGLGVVGNCRVL